MTQITKPDVRPANPCFSSGPCAKRPGWSLENLADAFLGRSHRHKDGKAKLVEVCNRTRALLGIPEDYLVGIVPGSNTGAIELAMWNLMGPRGVDSLVWEKFGDMWRIDVADEMKLDDVRVIKVPMGEMVDLTDVNFDRDVVFTWNGTTSGVMVANGDWIADDREGLTFCDATSAAFAMDLPWSKLDITTWSWQKVMGGEAAHGMLVMSPRAVERLESFTPDWPIPKLFRLRKKGKLLDEPFVGATINTPSMLCVEDAIDGLKWAEEIGGVAELQARNIRNFKAIEAWVAKTPWIEFSCDVPEARSTTSVTLKVVDPAFDHLDGDAMTATIKRMAQLVDEEDAGYDFAGHREAPPGFRIWAGATVETSDLEALFPWVEWAFQVVKADIQSEAA